MDYREFPLLYVDDEPDNLRIFELSFERDFSILTAETGEQGLRVLNQNPVAVVLSDYRMPGMTGVEFLSRAREIDPNVVRILVTAYGDAETLGDAINDGRIYKFIAKPWEPEDMGLTIRRAIEAYALAREREGLLDELTLINRLSRSMHRELELERLLRLLLDAAHNELEFDGAALLFFDKAGRQLSWAEMVPDGDVARRLREISIRRQSAPRFIASLRGGETQSLQLGDLSDLESPIRDWVTEVSADEIIVVPLVGQREVIGALAVDQRSGGRRFGADDRTLLDGLAIQAVIAIENARLVEDLRNTREQVRRADRLGTLGTLAAGLAHEINNPLVCVNTFLTLAPQKRQQADPEFWGEYHALAQSELERIRGLVATMSRLAHGGNDAMTLQEAVDLGELVREVTTLLQRELKAAGVALSLEVSPQTEKITAVRDQIHQVLLNLLLNAIHATPSGGSVKVLVEPDRDRPLEVVAVVVEDTGAGIPEEHLEQIFDPFFTTKEPDEGTGLGLMITHQIVADHDGTIDVRSQPGCGSCFRVRLPVKGRPRC
jgi:signal transduction histidine kinase/FixJ family two-component response regulator